MDRILIWYIASFATMVMVIVALVDTMLTNRSLRRASKEYRRLIRKECGGDEAEEAKRHEPDGIKAAVIMPPTDAERTIRDRIKKK